eukprot:Rmarinus@m.28709
MRESDKCRRCMAFHTVSLGLKDMILTRDNALSLLQEELRSARAQSEKYKARAKSIAQELEEKESEMESVTKVAEAKERSLVGQMQEQAQKLQSETKEAREEIKHLKGKLGLLEATRDSCVREKEEMGVLNDNLRERVGSLEAEVSQVQNSLRDRNAQLARLHRDVAKEREGTTSAKAQLTTAKERVVELEETMREYQARLSASAAALAANKPSQDRAEAAERELARVLHRTNESEKYLRRKLRDAHDETDAMKLRMKALEDELATQQARALSLAAADTSLQMSVEHDKIRFEGMEMTLSRLEGEAEEVAAAAEEAQRAKEALAQARKNLRQTDEELCQAEERVRASEKRAMEAEASAESRLMDLNSARSEIDSLKSRAVDTNLENNKLREEAKMLRSTVATLETTTRDLSRRLDSATVALSQASDMADRLSEAESRCESFVLEKDDAEARVLELEKLLRVSTSKQKSLEEACASTERRAMELERRFSDKVEIVKIEKQKSQELEKSILALQQKLVDESAKLQHAAVQCEEDHRHTIESLRKSVKLLEQRLKEAHRIADEAQDAQTSAEEMSSQCERNVLKLEARCADLDERLEETSKKLVAEKSRVKALEQKESEWDLNVQNLERICAQREKSLELAKQRHDEEKTVCDVENRRLQRKIQDLQRDHEDAMLRESDLWRTERERFSEQEQSLRMKIEQICQQHKKESEETVSNLHGKIQDLQNNLEATRRTESELLDRLRAVEGNLSDANARADEAERKASLEQQMTKNVAAAKALLEAERDNLSARVQVLTTECEILRVRMTEPTRGRDEESKSDRPRTSTEYATTGDTNQASCEFAELEILVTNLKRDKATLQTELQMLEKRSHVAEAAAREASQYAERAMDQRERIASQLDTARMDANRLQSVVDQQQRQLAMQQRVLQRQANDRGAGMTDERVFGDKENGRCDECRVLKRRLAFAEAESEALRERIDVQLQQNHLRQPAPALDLSSLSDSSSSPPSPAFAPSSPHPRVCGVVVSSLTQSTEFRNKSCLGCVQLRTRLRELNNRVNGSMDSASSSASAPGEALDASCEECMRLREELDRVSSALESARAELDLLRKQKLELQERLQTEKNESKKEQEKKREMERESEKEERDVLRNMVVRLERERDQLRDERVALLGENGAAVREKDVAEKQAKALRDEIESARAERAALRVKLDVAETERQEASEAVVIAKAESARLRTLLSATSNEVAELSTSNVSQDAKCSSLQTQLDAAQADALSLRTSLQREEKSSQDAMRTIASLKATLSSVEEERNVLHRTCEELRADCSKWESECLRLRTAGSVVPTHQQTEAMIHDPYCSQQSHITQRIIATIASESSSSSSSDDCASEEEACSTPRPHDLAKQSSNIEAESEVALSDSSQEAVLAQPATRMNLNNVKPNAPTNQSRHSETHSQRPSPRLAPPPPQKVEIGVLNSASRDNVHLNDAASTILASKWSDHVSVQNTHGEGGLVVSHSSPPPRHRPSHTHAIRQSPVRSKPQKDDADNANSAGTGSTTLPRCAVKRFGDMAENGISLNESLHCRKSDSTDGPTYGQDTIPRARGRHLGVHRSPHRLKQQQARQSNEEEEAGGRESMGSESKANLSAGNLALRRVKAGRSFFSELT